jgi:hypothetical protein
MTYSSNNGHARQGNPSSEGRGRGTYREETARDVPGASRRHYAETSASLKKDAIVTDLERLARQVPESIDPATGVVDVLWYAAARALRDRGRPVTAASIRERLEAQGRGHAARRPTD